MSSEESKIRRHLLTRAKKGRLNKKCMGQTYADNIGLEYKYKWIARVSSFYNIVMGCFKNGFPIAVSKLWYLAWAFYPFFFVRKDLKVKDPIPILNHERIHIRQQRDIHLTFSIPLLVLVFIAELNGWFNPIFLLLSIPFIPTIFYGIEMLRVISKMKDKEFTLNDVRKNTCFEIEANMHSTNVEYLFRRKFWAVLAYTGWKKFENYGIK